ncbi:PTS sugar transporter subunit IIB [Thermoflavimicrobium dichotomicum]|uniref:PTS system, cellobiose-specific IIB component n=1 Tax=Thermoflavimicrobium dichotomicum TaxID=46223 RepID=A0A1I3UR61_9BACL|nr:PTS sugar transporter subunit IIB [Thermoflavimicrobium dichotomicum]SFJ84311.1 PTS system, cellobiose-specific IIB component [Thermoflavimicrobium dichotomicum]
MKVLMVCSGGMSSSFVVNSIKKEAEKQGFALEINAVGSHEFEAELPQYDLGLVAPQVRHRLPFFQEVGKRLGKPVELIPPMGYTPLGAPQLLDLIRKHQRNT